MDDYFLVYTDYLPEGMAFSDLLKALEKKTDTKKIIDSTAIKNLEKKLKTPGTVERRKLLTVLLAGTSISDADRVQIIQELSNTVAKPFNITPAMLFEAYKAGYTFGKE